jgi:hypothetical protein
VTISGYSDTGSGSALVKATVGAGSQTSTSSTVPELIGYGTNGWGICSPTDPGYPSCNSVPNHAMDNSGNKESELLTFSSAVNLTSVTLGYAVHNATTQTPGGDISVLAYTGSGTPTLSGSTYGALSGWTLIGSYANVMANSAQALGTSVSSAYWLVAAYNSVFSAYANSSSANCSTCTNGDDIVKLYAAAGTTTSGGGRAPEPSVMLLFGTALVGAIGLRRREKLARA